LFLSPLFLMIYGGVTALVYAVVPTEGQIFNSRVGDMRIADLEMGRYIALSSRVLVAL
jgi:hypothetical protein